MTATAPAIDIITELKSAFADYQIVEKRGLAFGQRLYELRAKSSAQGNHSGTGFLPLLQQAGIPQRTAYYWIHSYEISIGERQPKEEKEKRADVVQAEHATTRIEAGPSAPISEIRHWSPDREKRKNRSTPVKDFEVLRTLAVKMLIAGYKELKTTGEHDNSHLYAAREWAQRSIADAEVVQ